MESCRELLSEDLDIPRCESPSSLHFGGNSPDDEQRSTASETPSSTLHCRGNCRDDKRCLTDSERAFVIALSACKDSQLCWENPAGDSMTQALIRILRKDRYPPLNVLLAGISHELYPTSLEVHKCIRKQKQDAEAAQARGEGVSDEIVLMKEDFQDPQIASHKPLDMTARFTLGSPHSLGSRIP